MENAPAAAAAFIFSATHGVAKITLVTVVPLSIGTTIEDLEGVWSVLGWGYHGAADAIQVVRRMWQHGCLLVHAGVRLSDSEASRASPTIRPTG